MAAVHFVVFLQSYHRRCHCLHCSCSYPSSVVAVVVRIHSFEVGQVDQFEVVGLAFEVVDQDNQVEVVVDLAFEVDLAAGPAFQGDLAADQEAF